MTEAERYRPAILANGGEELRRYLDLGGTFTRREIDAAVKSCDGAALWRLQRSLAQARRKERAA